ncbi:hypothetical protein RND81_13G080300 [Saponaria officinalis]|uniref:DUF569 domain-containing protein n=1 Tax=Saponaria officinalis TaxID=3572 RepID=A0AAW1GV94_SAPOF
MEFFKRAKVCRLKCGHHNKYLTGDGNDDTVRQSSKQSSTNAHWVIEPVEGKSNAVRFRSCQTHKYLATIDEPFLTGMTGKKLAQRLRLDSTVEWEPLKEGQYIKLKSHVGTLLRANSGLPPWRNTVTHDVPAHWSGSENTVLWIVDIVEIDYNSSRYNDFKGVSPEVVTDDNDVLSSSNTKQAKAVIEDEFGRMNSDRLSRLPSAETMSSLAVNVAKITIKELKYTDFHTVLSSGQIKKLEKAVNVIAADAKTSGRSNKDLINLEESLKDLENNHKMASEELEEFTTFSSRKCEIRAELKRNVAKARELEAIEAELQNTLTAAKAMRDELLQQLEEAENSVKGAEKGHADSKMETDELISVINQKTEAFKVMDSENETWQEKKFEAERTLERVEEDWLQVKNMISDFC